MKNLFLLTMAFSLLLFSCTKESATFDEVVEPSNELRMIEEYYPSAEVDVKVGVVDFLEKARGVVPVKSDDVMEANEAIIPPEMSLSPTTK